MPVTKVTLANAFILQNSNDPTKIRIWFSARRVGTLERIPTKTVIKDDFLNTPVPVTLPPKTTLPPSETHILVQDAEGTTLRAKGGGDPDSEAPHILITKLEEDFDGELVKPITFLWGLTEVTRGQTVHREVIGSGDATQRWQSFRLAKSPLTYVADPHAPGGRRPEVEVYVNGVKWRRAQSFYKATPTDEIYVIRHDAEHQTFIQFGDGELGKRLPTGTNNVVATYRFGVGGNVEANTITKLVRPIKGVKSVYNPLPATGGEDPPTEQEAREQAIQSTRVLGKLVSLVDFEVEAARYGGVLQAKARWAWDQAEDSAVVKVWIVTADEGDPSAKLRSYLMNRSAA
ncbi:MAG: baseplate J/gp47 family protein [Enhygromyxa sp.]